ncbi:hypothetical protein Droror1_Dr00025648, partial [Drosera rotundifolia]
SVPYGAMVNFVRSKWKKIVVPEVLLHGKRYYLFKCVDQKDLEKARASNWFMNS